MRKIPPFANKIITLVPGARALKHKIGKALAQADKPEFYGWGMVTQTFTPWHKGGDEIAREFSESNEAFISGVKGGEFSISQFEGLKNKVEKMEELMWRHYLVFWSARCAFEATNVSAGNLAECGVCDGMSAFFAMSALKGKCEFRAYLYDAWEGMKDDCLLESEMENVNTYSNLDIDKTEKNLSAFEDNTVFIKGFIPESFETSDQPAEIIWLHIDLNSAGPTIAALELFFNKLPPGGVILFDDYAWPNWYDTKLAIDEFLSDKSGILLPLPTGQAIYFKH